MPYDVALLEAFPTQPGVYLMKNDAGTVLYVGKANNLRQRVKQYFHSSGDARATIPLLLARVTAIETIVVFSEKDALLLENTLIKEHQPKYNALLKDDKSYIVLKINRSHRWPMVQIVRYKGKPQSGSLYFGPYTSALAARATLDLVNRAFPLRECSDQELVRRTRPCILYEMKRCCAPCVDRCSKQEYDHYVARVIKFLRGQDREVLQELYQEMDKEAEALEFEKAQATLKVIRQIEATLEVQHVNRPLGGDADVIAIFRQGEELLLTLLIVRSGKLMGSRHYSFSHIAEEDNELLSSFLLQHYQEQSELPKEILLPLEISDAPAITEILGGRYKQKVSIYTPQRGDNRRLVEMAYLNAEAAFQKEKDVKAIREKTLFEMQERFHLTCYPRKIECIDNSHLAGSESVAAVVTFTEGEKDKKFYRKYKIREAALSDDYGAMYEVLKRRYERAEQENTLPDLIIVDGGKGQLNIALKVMKELNVTTVDIIAVAKEAGRHDKGATVEQVFLPNVKDPILLKRHSPILFLLQQIRDEAHRFAITFHRQRRSKEALRSVLSQVPGIGPTKEKALLRHFGSVKKMKEASLEELQEVKGISRKNAEALLALKKEDGQEV
jgi:excinuclease ABC subunit C